MNQYINNREAQTLASISKSNIAFLGSTIETLSNLIENLKIYKQCIIDYFNMQSESTNTNNNSITYQYQSHTLPGVISVPQTMKFDNERMEQINLNKEKILQQKRIYFRLVDKDSKLYFQSFKGLQNIDMAFEEYIEILNGNINLSLQPNKYDDKQPIMKPSIKLSIDQKPYKKPTR